MAIWKEGKYMSWYAELIRERIGPMLEVCDET